MSRGKHTKRTFGGGRVTVVLVLVAAVLVLGGGLAFAAYSYDQATASRILPGIAIDSVDVGEMSRDEAIRAVTEKADLALSGDLVVQAAGSSWTVTPAGLGMEADVTAAVDQAFAVADSMSLWSRVYHRITGSSIERGFELGYTYDRTKVETFVQQAYGTVGKPARDAEISLVDGQLVRKRAHEGLELKVELATNRILRALERRGLSVAMPVKTLLPAVTEADLGYTLVVRLSENMLYVYNGLKVERKYAVATGAPGYPTPEGSFQVIDKAENPSWTNPAPDGWGADLPRFIPGGPGSPLGTRALYLDAPGIRIHGTYDLGSIGSYASHGCIRMVIAESEELYEYIPLGTPVLILR